MITLGKLVGLLATVGLSVGATLTWASPPLGEQVLTVCPEGPPTCQFSKIQEALDAAADGATISIWPGIYVEQEELLIAKNINLLGSEPRSVRLITGRVNVKGTVQVVISGLFIQGLASYGTLKVYEAKVTLANVNIVGVISVNDTETDTEQPKPSQLMLINVHVLSSAWALLIGPAAEAIVSNSELVSSGADVVIATPNAQLMMSRSLLRSTYYYGSGLLAAKGAKVWLYDTQIEISPVPTMVPDERSGAPAGIEAYEGSDLVLQRIKIFSTYHGVLVKNARLHIEASQVVAIVGWGVGLVIAPCGIRLPPIDFPSPQVFEGLITGRQNKISGGRELGDVCPSALEFLKTPQGGQYP